MFVKLPKNDLFSVNALYFTDVSSRKLPQMMQLTIFYAYEFKKKLLLWNFILINLFRRKDKKLKDIGLMPQNLSDLVIKKSL